VIIQALDLSILLESLHVTQDEAAALSSAGAQSIMRAVRLVLNELDLRDRGPAAAVGSASSLCDAYRVVTFALLAAQRASAIAAPSALDELVRYVKAEFQIAKTSRAAILRELKEKRSAENTTLLSDVRYEALLLQLDNNGLEKELEESRRANDEFRLKFQ
jgi:hypothetical protein